MTAGGQAAFEGDGAAIREGGGMTHWPLGICGQLRPCHFRPEVQDLDGAPPCPGLAGGKPEDAEEEEEDELEDDGDSLAGRSQDDTVCPTPEPQAACEDEEDGPASLAMGFDHTRRWAPAPGCPTRRGDLVPTPTIRPAGFTLLPSRRSYCRDFCVQAGVKPGPRKGGQGSSPPHSHARANTHASPGPEAESGRGRLRGSWSWTRGPCPALRKNPER